MGVPNVIMSNLKFWISNDHISATGDPIHFMFGARVGFSGSADRMALFPVCCLHPPYRWKFTAASRGFHATARQPFSSFDESWSVPKKHRQTDRQTDWLTNWQIDKTAIQYRVLRWFAWGRAITVVVCIVCRAVYTKSSLQYALLHRHRSETKRCRNATTRKYVNWRNTTTTTDWATVQSRRTCELWHLV